MRRVISIAIVAFLLAALVGGVAWYQYRNSVPKLLARAEVALAAREFGRSLELADRAIAKDPANWRGYYTQAMAYSGLRQYDEARKSLDEALRHGPPGVTIELAIAELYATPGMRTLASLESATGAPPLEEAIAHIQRAQEYLAGIQAKDEAGTLDVQMAMAKSLVAMGFAQLTLSKRLERGAQLAEIASAIKTRNTSRRASAEAAAKSDKSLAEACRILLDIAKRDSKRDEAAQMLVELALRRKDQPTLAAAWQWILAQEDPPPVPAAKLILQELVRTELQDKAEDSSQLAAAALKLDKVLAKHPEVLEVKIARAEVAARLADWPRAQALCGQVLDAKPSKDQQFRAKFIDARALAAQDKRVEAERELQELRTQVPGSAKLQYEYGRAARALGRKESAREAMRKAAELAPGYAAPRRYLAESLLADGLASAAFPEVKAYYDARPDDPNALRLFVRAAKATGQETAAEEALVKALEKCDPELHSLLVRLPRNASPDIAQVKELKSVPARPDLMMAAKTGYGDLGEKLEALAISHRAAQCKPTTAEEHLAVADALAAIDRVPEAEKMLTAERERNPTDPRFAEALAGLCEATGRHRQAIEEYRAAVRLDPRDTRYRERLARILMDGGLLDECAGECQAILGRDPGNAVALRMLNQVKLMRGEIGLDEMLLHAGAQAPTGLPLAQVYLSSGRFQKCVETCLAELKKTPNNMEARSFLGLAYAALGQNDKSIEQWTAILKDAPSQIMPYLQLADLLGKRMKADEVDAALAAIPGAKRDKIDLAMAGLLERLGRYDAAADTYGRLLTRQDVTAEVRTQARMLRAEALCRGGHIDPAIAELERLSEDPAWRDSALLAKASLLAAADRAKEADRVLGELRQRAVKDRNDVLLERMISLYMRMRQTDSALAACDALEGLLPNDPRPCIARAGVLTAVGRLGEASDSYRKAVERQPGDYRAHLALARTLDADDKPGPALDALKQLETQGQAARAAALLERGDMMARWGLAAQAAENYEQLAKLGGEGDPRLDLALGQAFARLGRKDRAREVLGRIPVYAPQYVPANQTLADLEDTDEGKLGIYRQIQKAKPGQPAVLIQEMGLLIRTNHPADAAKALGKFMADKTSAGALPQPAYFLALQAMILADDPRSAAGLAIDMARGTRSPGWRQLAALLTLDTEPSATKDLLPAPPEAGPNDAFLGLVLALRTGQEVAPWKGRLDQIQKALAERKPPQSLAPKTRFLAALASGAKAEAESELAKWADAPGIDRQAATELLAAAQNPKASAEAIELLKASLAADLGVPLMARGLAMKLLRARPTCQWAAVLATQCDPEGSLSREILKTLQPPDCLPAQTIRARLALEERQYEKAVEIRRAIATAEKGNPESMLDLGTALERAGHLEEALTAYRKVWEASQSPLAANNAAFLVSLLSPQDPAKLAEAGKWMAEVVKAAPADAAFRDTLGWILHLQGKAEQASLELRRAVKGLPDSPEVHYHLGVVEAPAARKELARWHLAAAVNIGDRFKAENRDLPPAAQQAVRLAREALAKMEQSKP